MVAVPRDPALRFVPLNPEPVPAGLRYAVALSRGRDDQNGSLVLLRSGVDLRVYLGATLDHAGRVIELLEIWSQQVGGLARSPATWRDYLTNQHLDREWTEVARQYSETAPENYRHTGWEETPASPMFVDAERDEVWSPVDPASGQPFQICQDDALLRSAGLPTYSDTLHRYWYVRQPNDPTAITWVAATPDAPTNPAVRPRSALLPANRPLLPLHPEGGLLQVRRFAPVSLDEYVDLLSGVPWRGLASGPEWAKLPGAYEQLGNWDKLLQEPGNLFLRGRTRRNVVAETFFLRLQLIYQLLEATASAVARRDLPLLNLSAESFRIELGPSAPGIPLLWSARPQLVAPGAAVALPIKATGLHHFLSLSPAVTTVYRPEFLGTATRGRGLVRIRRVATDTAGQISVEGTLVSAERLKLTPHDLLWIKLPQPEGVLDLFARCDVSEALASGECRFRTEPQPLDPGPARALRTSEGNSFDGTAFETVPMLSTPCDLYAVGVLAVRALLVNAQNSLGVALDETLSLARQMGIEEVEGDAVARVRSLVASDSRWLESLGPHRLVHEEMPPADIFAMVPEVLWWRTVAVIARMFPAQGPDSYCRDFSDVSPFAIANAFGPPLADLEKLLVQARGLLFSDWTANAEVARVLAQVTP